MRNHFYDVKCTMEFWLDGRQSGQNRIFGGLLPDSRSSNNNSVNSTKFSIHKPFF
jgi:hypothetical protein